MIEVPRYEIIEELGRGGMATVYKARQPSLGRFIAIKVLPPYFAHDEEFVQRFKREALAVAKLRHPNIVQVYNFHQEGDLFYLAMEYIEGGSLAQLMENEGPLSLELSASIVKQTAAALDHAHKKGFIHRDIKPSNILLTADRQAVLTDFGITKAMDATRLTKTTFGGGTSEYMPPEQAKGDPVDGRSDFYSLGVVFYEMLAGRCPFEGGNPLSVIHSQVYDAPPKPREFNAAIPAPVEAIILKLLAKEPAARFKNGLELAAKLAQIDFKELSKGSSTTIKASKATKLKPAKTKSVTPTKATTIKKTPAMKASSAPQGKKAKPKQTQIKKTPTNAVGKKRQIKKSAGNIRSKQTLVKRVDKKVAPIEKNIISEAGQEAGTGRFKKVALIAASLAVLGMVAAFAWSSFSNRYPFHYQFKSITAVAGGAEVSREINLQTNGSAKELVVALRVKGGQGDVEVRESIPKSLASSVKDIRFNQPPTRVINDDPVVLWRFKAKAGGSNLIYRVDVSKSFQPKDFDKVVAGYKELPKLNKIIFLKPKLKAWAGRSYILKAAGIMSDETTNTKMSFVWKSSNPKVAQVDNHGRLTAVQAGKSVVTVSIGKVKATLPVTIFPVLKSIRIQPEKISIREGEARQLSAQGTMSDGSEGTLKVKWSLVGEGGNGSVDSGGYFSAVTHGKVRIIAVAGEISAQIEVDIQAAPVSAPARKVQKRKSGGSKSRTRYSAPTPAPAPSPTPAPSGGSSGGSIAPSTDPPVNPAPEPIHVVVP